MRQRRVPPITIVHRLPRRRRLRPRHAHSPQPRAPPLLVCHHQQPGLAWLHDAADDCCDFCDLIHSPPQEAPDAVKHKGHIACRVLETEVKIGERVGHAQGLPAPEAKECKVDHGHPVNETDESLIVTNGGTIVTEAAAKSCGRFFDASKDDRLADIICATGIGKQKQRQQVQNFSPTSALALQAPDQGGLKRVRCEAELSDSQQGNTKMRPDSVVQSLRQEHHGALSHKLPIAVHGVMETDGCVALALVSRPHDKHSEEDPDQPNLQGQNFSFRAASDVRAIPEDKGENNTSTTQVSTPERTPSISLPRDKYSEVRSEDSDQSKFQGQDGSFRAASDVLLVPEHNGENNTSTTRVSTPEMAPVRKQKLNAILSDPPMPLRRSTRIKKLGDGQKGDDNNTSRKGDDDDTSRKGIMTKESRPELRKRMKRGHEVNAKTAAAPRHRKSSGQKIVETSSDDDDDVDHGMGDETHDICTRRGKVPPREVDSGGSDEEDEDEEEESGATHSEILKASRRPKSYMGKTDQVRELRRKDPRRLKRDSTDYRFHTSFQKDYYKTVIMAKKTPVSVSQWIDWEYMEGKNDPVFKQIISACKSRHIKKIMGWNYNWNTKIIAQFYATVYFQEEGGKRKMHWMTQGGWYAVSYRKFASYLGFGEEDKKRPKIHSEKKLPLKETNFMYPPDAAHKYGAVRGLCAYYSYLNRMFRKTLVPREGDTTVISSYEKNLLARMRQGGESFSVVDFIWKEIKNISMSPLRSCGYAPYLMSVIERVTRKTFRKDARHEPLRIKLVENPVVVPVAPIAPSAAVEAPAPLPSPPRGQTRQQGQSSFQSYKMPPSPYCLQCNMVLHLLESIHNNKILRHRKRQKEKRFYARMLAGPPFSPLSSDSEGEGGEVETFADMLARGRQRHPLLPQMGCSCGPSRGFSTFKYPLFAGPGAS